MNGYTWTVYWDNLTYDTYIYGSEIRFLAKDNVEFKNRLMSPGSVIKSWRSKTNFQMRRIEPSLPLIDGEGSYVIRVNISCADADGYLLRLVFYNRYDEETGNIIIRENEQVFRCPLSTYSYEIQLINAGISEFHFHYITISEVPNDEQEAQPNT